jgi:hypothetical protein
LFLIIAICILGALYLFFSFRKEWQRQDINKINQSFSEFSKLVSPDNVSSQQQKANNYKIFPQIEQSISLFKTKHVQDYFTGNTLTESELLNCLYVIQSLCTHYMYNQQDYLKAQSLLLNIKTIAEQYIKTVNNLKINFSELSKEELFSEFKIVKGLSEIYTRAVYLLGRTFVMQDNHDEALKYFETSKYFSDQLGLFESFLSIGSDFEFIKSRKIENYIKNGDYEHAKLLLIKSIEESKKLLNDEKEYIANYNPNKSKQEIIIPKNSIYNKVLFTEKLIKQYVRLVNIINDDKEILPYVDHIASLFFGNEKTQGLLELSQGAVEEKKASTYNILANTLLRLYEKGINLKSIKDKVIKELKFDMEKSNDLDIIEKIYNLALSKSRVTNYVKADIFEGLRRVYQKKLELKDLSHKQIQQLKDQIILYKTKQEDINKQLNREDWKLLQNKI